MSNRTITGFQQNTQNTDFTMVPAWFPQFDVAKLASFLAWPQGELAKITSWRPQTLALAGLATTASLLALRSHVSVLPARRCRRGHDSRWNTFHALARAPHITILYVAMHFGCASHCMNRMAYLRAPWKPTTHRARSRPAASATFPSPRAACRFLDTRSFCSMAARGTLCSIGSSSSTTPPS
jgi:hypothetical protein